MIYVHITKRLFDTERALILYLLNLEEREERLLRTSNPQRADPTVVAKYRPKKK